MSSEKEQEYFPDATRNQRVAHSGAPTVGPSEEGKNLP
jgi:hypothetical protein